MLQFFPFGFCGTVHVKAMGTGAWDLAVEALGRSWEVGVWHSHGVWRAVAVIAGGGSRFSARTESAGGPEDAFEELAGVMGWINFAECGTQEGAPVRVDDRARDTEIDGACITTVPLSPKLLN